MSAVMFGKMKVVFDKAFSLVGKGDTLVNFGLAFETKKGKHIEVGYIDGGGYIFVNGVKVFPPTADEVV